MKTKCTLCNSRRYKKIYIINGYEILKCDDCSFIFTSSWPDTKELKELYRGFDYKDGFANEKLIRHDAKRILRNLRLLGYRRGRLLDLGSGTGFLLDEARKAGWNTLGVDLASLSVKHAREKLKLKIINEDILKFNSKTHFNVIILSHVIEHLPDPYPILDKILSLLDNNGVLCISTPNITSALAKVLGIKFNYLIPPYHVLYFSPKTFKRLLESVRFKIVKTTSYGYPEDVGAIYRALRERWRKKANFKRVKKNFSRATPAAEDNLSGMKKIKHDIFENIVRKFTYPFLDIGLNGSTIEFYVKKSDNSKKIK